jgi:hypothetical protein
MNFKPWTEAREQQQVCKYLDNNNYFYTAIINDMWTNSYQQKNKAKAIWLKPWCSDLIIKLKNNSLLFLEMKKKRWIKGWNNWSKKSIHQINFQKKINEVKNVQYEFAFWFDEAIKIINELENI